MPDTVLFTDHVTLAIASAITLVFGVLLVSKGIEQLIGRLEFRIRQAMWSDINR
jgi:uncharacterized membrane protein HdeD (DUF308 family)